MLVFDFRCPLCKSISTLDIPMLGSPYVDLPIEWLRSRLLPNIEQSNSMNLFMGFDSLGTWLLGLSRWLNMNSNSNPIPSGKSIFGGKNLNMVCNLYDFYEFR